MNRLITIWAVLMLCGIGHCCCGGGYVYQARDAEISAGLQKISLVRSYSSGAFEPDEDTVISVLPIGSIIFLAITDDPNALEEAQLWDLCDAESDIY